MMMIIVRIFGGSLGRADCCIDNVPLFLNSLNVIQLCSVLDSKPNFVIILISLFICICFVVDVNRMKVNITHQLMHFYIQGVPGEWTKLRESVPYVELYQYNPKHLYPNLNGYGDNGQRILKL